MSAMATPSPPRLAALALVLLASVELIQALLSPTPPAALRREPGAPSLRDASVEVIDARGHTKPCPRTGPERFQCDTPEWAHVGPTTKTIGGRRVACIWAHPLEGRTIRMTFPRVTSPGDDKKPRAVAFALVDAAVGTGHPIAITARLGDTPVKRHTHPDARGWRRVTLPTIKGAAPLVIEIQGKNTGRRHLCMRLQPEGSR